MHNVDLVALADILIKLAAVIGAYGVITAVISKHFTKKVKEVIEPLAEQVADVRKRIDETELDGMKNYLASYLSKLELGQPVTEIETERFYDSYQKYTELGGNSYIKGKVDRLKNEGKLA